MGNILKVRREVYVSSSSSNLLTPDLLMLYLSKYLTSNGIFHIPTSKGFIIHDDTDPGFFTYETIYEELPKDLTGFLINHCLPVDLIVSDVSGAATIKVANHNRELRLEPRKLVKGQLTIPMGALKIHENRETKLNFSDSTAMVAGMSKDHILWGQSKDLGDLFNMAEFVQVDVTDDVVLLRMCDELGSKDEIKSVVPGVFIITWVTVNEFFPSRYVRFQHGSRGSFEIHSEFNYSQLSNEGDGEEGKIDIQNVQDGSLKLIFPMAVILSIIVQPGRRVTLIRWRKNEDDVNSKVSIKPNSQASSLGKTPSGNSSFGHVVNLFFNNAVKNFELFGHQNISTSLFGTGTGATTNIGSVTSVCKQ
ncbi:hypothetical protein NE237_028522 [Protea cynaroides]|uniref:Uncharacterized protein n=1 Tax=Protea cynaroides TaxID=273540 RepID=A0A9Q0GQH8_9MAGN|nr:hypothetical protein NE237_028522 [Protea cynaroides]